jgi:hypothetical protein
MFILTITNKSYEVSRINLRIKTNASVKTTFKSHKKDSKDCQTHGKIFQGLGKINNNFRNLSFLVTKLKILNQISTCMSLRNVS